MKISRWICAAALIALVFQGCSTSGLGTTASGGSAAGGETGSRSEPPSVGQTGPSIPGAKDLVPAVVGLPPDPGPAGTYRIGPHDLLKIQVFEVAELSSEERVNEAGAIMMPLIGAVQVGGLTPAEAEQLIANTLQQNYLQDPQVNVFVSEYASQEVTVGGSVKKPGVFPIKGRMTLLQAIAKAEGIDPLANDEEVIVFRSQGGTEVKAYVVDLAEVQKGNLPDPPLIGDDRVMVPQSGSAVFIKSVTDSLRGLVSINPMLY